MANADELRDLIDRLEPGLADRDIGISSDETASPVDWSRLFPPSSAIVDRGPSDFEVFGDDWQPDFGANVVHDIEGALFAGEGNVGDEAPCGNGNHVCAWYVPLHASRSGWGIYLREACVIDRMPQIAAQMITAAGGPVVISSQLFKALYRAAAYQLYLHEQFHHKIESLAFRLTIIENRLRYPVYENRVYSQQLGTDDCLEEALANADAYNRLREPTYQAWIGSTVMAATRQRLQQAWPKSPPGYRIANRYVSKRSNKLALAVLQAQVHEGSRTPSRVDAWRLSANMHESLFSVADAIYTVIPKGTSALMPIR